MLWPSALSSRLPPFHAPLVYPPYFPFPPRCPSSPPASLLVAFCSFPFLSLPLFFLSPPTPFKGTLRHDESSCIVIDGLVTDAERQQLLTWLTNPGHDHHGAPPCDKWERACVDRTGDAATWGLRPEVITSLREDPPEAAVALQAMVAALYPEWVVAHMPCEVRGNGGRQLCWFHCTTTATSPLPNGK